MATPDGQRLRQIAAYSVVAISVWLAWEVAKVPLADRAPPAIAVRLSPNSPEVLRRASEAELLAKRYNDAHALSAYSVGRGPFNARALRVWGLAEAETGAEAKANQALTLAGNWSLRDDPTHAWLTEYRLRQGDYGSSFAHADTIARRRPDTYPQIFNLFATAALTDQRSLPALLKLLARNPPWRAAFFDYLYADASRAGLLATLAISLDRSDGRMSATELQQLYTTWANAGRFPGLKLVRRALGRPGDGGLQNGDFQAELETQLYPFGWRLGSGPGVAPAVLEDDANPANLALRVDYDGFGRTRIAEQMVMLEPGHHELGARLKAETPAADLRMQWTVSCAESGQTILRRPVGVGQPDAAGWGKLAARFTVPSTGCAAQWVRLEPVPGDRRTGLSAWFDDIRLRSATSGADTVSTDFRSATRTAQ